MAELTKQDESLKSAPIKRATLRGGFLLVWREAERVTKKANEIKANQAF